MIYAGTFPDRPAAQGELNVINMGNTGRGKWGRALIKAGRNAGSNRMPAQAMLSLGRYWSDRMPQGDRNWWHARGQAFFHATRYGANKKVNGYALFLMANIAAFVLEEELVLIPIPWTNETGGGQLFSQIESKPARGKFYKWWLTAEPTAYQNDTFVSAIKGMNGGDKDPLKMTKLIGVHRPNEVIHFGFPPETPQYHLIPWAVNVGEWCGIHFYGRFGAKTGTHIFRTTRWLHTMYWKKAV